MVLFFSSFVVCGLIVVSSSAISSAEHVLNAIMQGFTAALVKIPIHGKKD